MSHRYFIAYVIPSGFTVGNCDATLPMPIRSMDDIGRLQQQISEWHQGLAVIITNWQRFHDGDAEEG